MSWAKIAGYASTILGSAAAGYAGTGTWEGAAGAAAIALVHLFLPSPVSK